MQVLEQQHQGHKTAAAAAGYSLPAEDRRALLAGSREGRRTLLIERQRLTFIALHGSPFGGGEDEQATQ
ncbi:MAG: hypothetical protein Q8J72_08925 [Rhodocyclaceae bacterium]|jgi:hypothetical protein|nr:hypothetical protein [Rhodocyclaceae bacterium]